MNKKSKSSKTPEQKNLIDPPVVIDFAHLLTEAALSENERGIVKRRLIENRESFVKVLQGLLQRAQKEQQPIDIAQSLKLFEEEETREIKSFDAIAKVLSKDFPELLQFILEEYQVDVKHARTLIGKEFVLIKRIADVIFEATDKQGNEVIIHLELERKYESDEKMDKRKLEYRHLMEMDDYFEGKNVLCNVFYLRGSPEHKTVIEERNVKLPASDPRYSAELKYKAYHLSLVTIDMIIERNLPFLLPFVVESELRAEVLGSKITHHLSSLRQQIDNHEEALTQMIKTLTPEKMESLRTTVEYLWGKSYSKQIFNQSTLLQLMRERLTLRQDDILWGKNAGKAEEKAKIKAFIEQLIKEGKTSQAQMEEVLKHLNDNCEL